MSESEVTLSKKDQKRFKSREQAADVTADIVSSATPAKFSSESLLEMSSNFSSPKSEKSTSNLGDYQIDLLNKLDKDSISVIDLLNIVAMQ